jgi:hypothetical protein
MTAMSDQELLDRAERAARGIALPDGRFDDLLRRRDRKRRNQRIAAGVVGIAVFVAAVWVVTSGLSFDRTQTPLGPGPTETGPAETAPAPASAAPDVVRTGTCSDSATWRLELTQVEPKTRVRFEVHQSPVGHRWRIQLHHRRTGLPFQGTTFFRGTRVATGDGGDLAVQQLVNEGMLSEGYRAKAIDTKTGQVCSTGGWIG